MLCDHEKLVVNGGSMVRRTDHKGRETRICSICGFNPAAVQPRSRGDSGMFAAIADAQGTSQSKPVVDVLADMDRNPPKNDTFPENIKDDLDLLEYWEEYQKYGFWDPIKKRGIGELAAAQLRAYGAPI